MQEPIEVTEQHVSIYRVMGALVNWYFLLLLFGFAGTMVVLRLLGISGEGWLGVVLFAVAVVGALLVAVAFSWGFYGLHFGEVYGVLLFMVLLTVVFPLLRTGHLPLWLQGQRSEQALGIGVITAFFLFLKMLRPYPLVEDKRQWLKRVSFDYVGPLLMLLLVAVFFGEF